ncbi:GATA transcription factor 12-like protein [Tanacetum coccineum]|uniref:GATA transcription factor n=1 Tax=Tanacetum coccineum TaxID=301880 RepID=A0ABQ4ZDV3_9ASTR
MEFPQEPSPYYNANNQQFTPEKRNNDSKTDHFIVDDLLDFPVDDLVEEDVEIIEATSTDSSTVVDSCNSSSLGSGGPEPSFVDTQLSNLFVPYDDLAEFEWLSNSVEESFSNEDLQKFQLISGIKARSKYASDSQQFQTMAINSTNNPIFNIDMTVPSKARTKRSRASSCNWASQVRDMSTDMSSNCVSDITSNSIAKSAMTAMKKVTNNNSSRNNDDGRKCLHCATDKTPQWRTGPMGPRTLCNACGVRYKSGRLVPEYRPVASPTFVLTKHSNSHRKVLELRRKKEMQKSQHHPQHFLNGQNAISHMPNRDDYLIHQHIDPYYRQLI